MKFSKKTAGIAATSLMAVSLVSLSAFADSRPQTQTMGSSDRQESPADNNRYDRNDRNDRNDNGGYDRNDRNDRNDNGRYDRDGQWGRHDRDRIATIAGTVERIDYRRDAIVLRDGRSGRTILVDMDRVEHRRRQADLSDIRRGDFVRLTGEWERGGFEAYRIDDIRSRRRW